MNVSFFGDYERAFPEFYVSQWSEVIRKSGRCLKVHSFRQLSGFRVVRMIFRGSDSACIFIIADRMKWFQMLRHLDR